MTNKKRASRSEKGIVVIYTTLSLLVMLPLVGLAIDVGTLYLIRTRMSCAVDAASLAAARSLSTGGDVASQVASATTVAQKFFRANFPDGFFNTTAADVRVNVVQNGDRSRSVTTSASLDAPLYLLRVLNQSGARIAVQSVASRRDVNLMLVLDRSGSMGRAGVCGLMAEDAKLFVSKFTPGRDKIGLVTFGGSAIVAYRPSLNFATGIVNVNTLLDETQCGGSTGSAQALSLAYQELVNLREPGALNVIVFFTDGRPTALTASYPVLTTQDLRTDKNGSTQNVGPSSCRDEAGLPNTDPAWNPQPKVGFMAGYVGSFNPTGATFGLLPATAASVTDVSELNPITNSDGCAFQPPVSARSSQSTAYPYFELVHRDIAFIPEQDFYGNNTDTGYKPVLRFTSGPYNGRIRPDSPQSIRNAAYNAVDSAASRIRANLDLGVITYTIALGGNDTEGIDDDFMRRIANDPGSSIYDNLKPKGLYVFAPNAAQLSDAFNRVASQVLSLTM